MQFTCDQCGQTLPLRIDRYIRQYLTWYCLSCGKGHDALLDVDADERLRSYVTLRPPDEVAVD